MINSLRSQLRCAEKERGKGAEGVEGEIWNVEYPAEQLDALQMIVLKWQSGGGGGGAG